VKGAGPLETGEGTKTLPELFDGRSQLLGYHFMFGPSYTAGCPTCSAAADTFDGGVVHLNNRDVTFLCASRAPLAKLQEYERRMGWTFPWVSTLGSDSTSISAFRSLRSSNAAAPDTTTARSSCCPSWKRVSRGTQSRNSRPRSVPTWPDT
jgi:predicted dithiol-disulfide oxidoreductase (DUF899 family)